MHAQAAYDVHAVNWRYSVGSINPVDTASTVRSYLSLANSASGSDSRRARCECTCNLSWGMPYGYMQQVLSGRPTLCCLPSLAALMRSRVSSDTGRSRRRSHAAAIFLFVSSLHDTHTVWSAAHCFAAHRGNLGTVS